MEMILLIGNIIKKTTANENIKDTKFIFKHLSISFMYGPQYKGLI